MYNIEAYITNLGMYNEGRLVGVWARFPLSLEELDDVKKAIGIDGVRYKEMFNTDYVCKIKGLSKCLGEYDSIKDLNTLSEEIGRLDDSDLKLFSAIIETEKHASNIDDVIKIIYNLDDFCFMEGVKTYEDLGQHEAKEMFETKIYEQICCYFDFESFGKDTACFLTGDFTSFGYVYCER